MTAPAPVLHIHHPHAGGAGICPVCDLELGPSPARIESGGRSELICASCELRIAEALSDLGRRRVRLWLSGGRA